MCVGVNNARTVCVVQAAQAPPERGPISHAIERADGTERAIVWNPSSLPKPRERAGASRVFAMWQSSTPYSAKASRRSLDSVSHERPRMNKRKSCSGALWWAPQGRPSWLPPVSFVAFHFFIR